MPFYWLDTSAPEWAVMEINVDLPIAVYWRLARRYPHLVSGETINTGEIRGEFLRVLDQGRGLNANRQLNSHESHATEKHHHALPTITSNPGTSDPAGQVPDAVFTDSNNTGVISNRTNGDNNGGNYGYLRTYNSSNNSETRPTNVARPMAIVI